MEEETTVTTESAEATTPASNGKRMPRKGRDNPTLLEKENLKDALREMTSVRAFAKKQGVGIPVLMNWMGYHELDLPSRDEMAVAKFYEGVELDETTQCWNWKGKATVSFQGKPMRPDRFAVAVVAGRGDLGKKRLVRTCGNENCVNPDHLVLKSELVPVASEPAVPEVQTPAETSEVEVPASV